MTKDGDGCKSRRTRLVPRRSREQKPGCWLSARRGPLPLSRSGPRRDRGTVGPSGSYVPLAENFAEGSHEGWGSNQRPASG